MVIDAASLRQIRGSAVFYQLLKGRYIKEIDWTSKQRLKKTVDNMNEIK